MPRIVTGQEVSGMALPGQPASQPGQQFRFILAILACLFALPAAAQTTSIWNATLTVDHWSLQAGAPPQTFNYYGCASSGGTSCSTALSDDEFTHGGTTYTVEEFFWNNGSGNFVAEFSGISASTAKTALSEATLNAGSKAFNLADASPGSSDTLLTWSTSNPNWPDGQQISVSLTIPSPAPAPDPGPDPAIVRSATVDGRTLTVTFTQALRESPVPAPSAFDVRAEGDRREVRHVLIDGRVLTLRLFQPVDIDRAVTLTYRQPASNASNASRGPLDGRERIPHPVVFQSGRAACHADSGHAVCCRGRVGAVAGAAGPAGVGVMRHAPARLGDTVERHERDRRRAPAWYLLAGSRRRVRASSR